MAYGPDSIAPIGEPVSGVYWSLKTPTKPLQAPNEVLVFIGVKLILAHHYTIEPVPGLFIRLRRAPWGEDVHFCGSSGVEAHAEIHGVFWKKRHNETPGLSTVSRLRRWLGEAGRRNHEIVGSEESLLGHLQ